ncbi:MAG: sugar kinase [Synechococcus sp. NAT40]|nr:sugar kinase [Synechococcus sp. NAT40]
MTPLALGIDLGTSGVRIAVIDAAGHILHNTATTYRQGLQHPEDWRSSCRSLIQAIPANLRSAIQAIAVDGTSGTLLACDHHGTPIGHALSYAQSCPEFAETLMGLLPGGGPASSCSGSLARALRLIQDHGEGLLLRHQADWINGWLLNDWQWGEEGNNLRLGWDLERGQWNEAIATLPWADSLPTVRPSGSDLGRLAAKPAQELGLCSDVTVVAGTTDSNAAVLAANPGDNDGITVLGSTLVLKRFTTKPLTGPGITSHRVAGRWLCGGASNSGGAVLLQQFPGINLDQLSRQINPEQSSGLELRPLPAPGERFPSDDPTLEPVLTPRPVSDCLYLHALLEGMARIEAEGWERLTELGAQPPKRVITLGGGARNPQWRRLRERILHCPVLTCLTPPAAGVARLALNHLQGKGLTARP